VCVRVRVCVCVCVCIFSFFRGTEEAREGARAGLGGGRGAIEKPGARAIGSGDRSFFFFHASRNTCAQHVHVVAQQVIECDLSRSR
jgi:hypothetical protein